MPNKFKISLRHDVRSQVSGTAYSVFNFDALELLTLQPMYRDQLLALWRRYVVLGITVEHRIVNKSTSVDSECLIYHGSGTTVSNLTFSQALEYKYTKRHILSSNGNSKTLVVRSTVWFDKYLPPKYWDDSDFWGDASGKPPFCISADGYQHAIGFFSVDGTSALSLMMDRRITFHVQFFELAAISNSLNGPPNELPVFEQPFSVSDDEEIIPQTPVKKQANGKAPKKSK
jgi:hypothetical protein